MIVLGSFVSLVVTPIMALMGEHKLELHTVGVGYFTSCRQPYFHEPKAIKISHIFCSDNRGYGPDQTYRLEDKPEDRPDVWGEGQDVWEKRQDVWEFLHKTFQLQNLLYVSTKYSLYNKGWPILF